MYYSNFVMTIKEKIEIKGVKFNHQYLPSYSSLDSLKWWCLTSASFHTNFYPAKLTFPRMLHGVLMNIKMKWNVKSYLAQVRNQLHHNYPM